MPSAEAVLGRLLALPAAARAAGALVVHLQNDGAPGLIDEPDTLDWAIHPAATPQAGERVLRKTGDDGFEGTDLEGVLTSAGVRRIAVAGLLSEMCVSATVRSALASGFDVVLVNDAHATCDPDNIPSVAVSRAAEHALGDQVEFAPTVALTPLRRVRLFRLR